MYHKLLQHTRTIASASSTNKYLFYDTSIIEEDIWSEGFTKKLQAEGNLGDRMKAAFSTVLEEESMAVIIGSDCPEISTEIIEEALYKLEIADVVIGPTHDGGYYLLGMKEFYPTLFDKIEWSTEKVFEQTKNNIINEGLLYTVLTELSDLDNEEDLRQFPNFAE